MKKFLKCFPVKLWILLFALLVLTFFSNDFGLVDIQKTALVLAAGIDRDEDGFRLTAQIAVPKGTDRTTGGTSSVEIEGRGSTVSECISDLYARTGWVPKLIYCDLVVLGESAAEKDVFDCLDAFLRNEYIPDSCLLAACAGSAGELLSSTSAIDDTSALALEKLFSDAAEQAGQVMTTTLREFAIGYFGESRSGYMPYVRAQAQEGSDQGQGGSQSGGQSMASPKTEEKIYSARETAIFSDGVLVGILSPEETFAFSLLKSNVYAGTFSVDGTSYLVLRDKGDIRVTASASPAFSLFVDCTVQCYGENHTSAPEQFVKGTLSRQEEEAVSARLTQSLQALWTSCTQAECDLLFFRRSLRRASPAVYAAWKDLPLSALPVTVQARVRSLR